MAMAYPSAFISFVVVEQVQVLLFELTNFLKVEFIRKEKGGLLLLVFYLEQGRIT